MTEINFDAWAVKLAGVAGAIVSMNFLSGTPRAKITMAATGVIISYYASKHISDITGLPEGFSGFLLGVFGMAIVSKGWEVVKNFPAAEFTKALIDRVRGRP